MPRSTILDCTAPNLKPHPFPVLKDVRTTTSWHRFEMPNGKHAWMVTRNTTVRLSSRTWSRCVVVQGRLSLGELLAREANLLSTRIVWSHDPKPNRMSHECRNFL